MRIYFKLILGIELKKFEEFQELYISNFDNANINFTTYFFSFNFSSGYFVLGHGENQGMQERKVEKQFGNT
jgi:hypothetical protein